MTLKKWRGHGSVAISLKIKDIVSKHFNIKCLLRLFSWKTALMVLMRLIPRQLSDANISKHINLPGAYTVKMEGPWNINI